MNVRTSQGTADGIMGRRCAKNFPGVWAGEERWARLCVGRQVAVPTLHVSPWVATVSCNHGAVWPHC